MANNRKKAKAAAADSSLDKVTAWTALAAVIVDFPHCLVQFNTTRLLPDSSTRACVASGLNASFRRTHSASPPGSLLPVLRLPASITLHMPQPTTAIVNFRS